MPTIGYLYRVRQGLCRSFAYWSPMKSFGRSDQSLDLAVSDVQPHFNAQ
jgi:hypothetical protein